MRIVEQSRLVDALADWGRHEAMMRSGLPSETFDGADGFIEAVNFALQFRSPLVARILAARPMSVLNAEIDSADIPLLRLADTRTIEEWKVTASHNPKSFNHYRALAESAEPVDGPLVCTAQTDGSKSYVAPIIVFDGWHRVAAWTEQLGRVDYPITAYLIITKDPVPLLTPAL